MPSIENIRWAPETYREVNVIAELAGKELLERLSWMMLQPNCILDVACGLSSSSEDLTTRYPAAKIIRLDNDRTMLSVPQAVDKIYALQADGKQLPLRAQCVDLLFANLILPWQKSLETIFKEWRRVTKPDGLLLFSMFGPDTLKSWQSLFQNDDFVLLRDMHDIGDLLLALGFIDPVLDVEHVTVSYSCYEKLCEELVATGIWFPEPDVYQKLLNDKDHLPSLEINYEIIYGHAFAPLQQQKSSQEFSIPLSTLRSQLKK